MAIFVDNFGLDEFDHVVDLRGELWRTFGITAQPTYVFINDDGTISRSAGGIMADELIAQIELLRAS